ncbi:MAG: M20 family metallopeptidase [Chloroflexi bacterium]|nr:M20 family metallopeptidase [Chloroflexota bacterium]MCL5075239.1 M20 family metallopeptidase [Chloroflexota bacterium]
MDVAALKRIVGEEIDRRREDLVRLSTTIHANPELGFQEFQAMRLLTDWLEELGFTVERGLSELPTAFRAAYQGQKEGPRVAFLAEYDALAELGHACGHNIIGVASVGAAAALRQVMDDLPGTIVVLGTPAEEGGGGKILLSRRGALDGLDACMLVHPDTRTTVIAEALGAVSVDVQFFGKASHAAAAPERGINALDALVLSYNNINALRQHIRPDARIHGIITKGGEAPNIIPSHTAGRFMIRAKDGEYLESLVERVLACFRAAAEATGARLEYRLLEPRYEPMRTNQALAAAFAANLETLGVAIQPFDPERGYGSTDMGNVSQIVPSIHPHIAIASEEVAVHSPEFAVAAISEEGQQALLLSAKAMAMTAIDIFTDAELLTSIKAEFQARPGVAKGQQ